MVWEVLTRFALAIVLDAFAFVVWDVGTRPPLRLLRDLLRGARVPAMLGRGVLRFALGGGLLLLGAVIARPAMPSAQVFTLLETGMLVAALIVEALIGTDLRARLVPMPPPRPAKAALAKGQNAKDSAEG